MPIRKLPIIAGGFTVLMAVYKLDSPAKFEAAVKSVFANTLLPNSFQLVVDGPIPECLMSKVLELQSHHAINVVFLQKNVGLAVALNRGIEKISTEWIARADADDINLPNRFEILAREIGEDVDIVGSAIREVDENGLPTGVRLPPLSDRDIRKYARRRNPFNHMTVMYRTQLVKKYKGYPEIYLREDYALWAILLAAGSRALNVPDILVEVSAGDGLIRRRGGVKYALGELRLQQYLVRHNIKSFWCALIDGFARGSIFCLPDAMRSLIYKLFLRDKSSHLD
jgi:glycosyltransferase involved in cell wall biosynthesis